MSTNSNQSSPRSDRFAFGENWARFLGHLTNEKIAQSKQKLLKFTELSSFENLTFLDIGSGSGLSSLAARQLQASVHSFDYDQRSVACTQELKNRYSPSDQRWQVEQGSALDRPYMESLGKFDIVYSWGVLHHTGDMWSAIDSATIPVKNGGMFYLAIYNDQGVLSTYWWHIKKAYNKGNRFLRCIMVLLISSCFEIAHSLVRLFTFRNPLPFSRWRRLRKERGMSIWYDWVDWIGGFPFEVATPDEIFHFLRARGFVLKNLKTIGGGWGCCEYLFVKQAAPAAEP